MAEEAPEMTPQQEAWQGFMDALQALQDAVSKLQGTMPSENGNTTEAPAQEAPAQETPVEEPVAEEPTQEPSGDTKDESKELTDKEEEPKWMKGLRDMYAPGEVPEEVIKAVKENPPKEEGDNSKEPADKSNNGKGEQPNDNADENSNDQGDDDASDGEDKKEEPANDIAAGMPGEFQQLFQFLQAFLELIKLFTQIMGSFVNNPQALANAAGALTNQNPQDTNTPAQEPASDEPEPTPEPTEGPTDTPAQEPATEEPTETPVNDIPPKSVPTPEPTGTPATATEPAEPTTTATPEPTTEGPVLTDTPIPDVTIQGRDGGWTLNEEKGLLIGPGGTYHRDDKGTWRSSIDEQPVDFTGENGLFNQCPDLRNHITSQTNENGFVTYFGPTPEDPDATIKYGEDGNIDTITMSGPGYSDKGNIFQVKNGMVYNAEDTTSPVSSLTDFMKNNLAHYPGIKQALDNTAGIGYGFVGDTPAPIVANNISNALQQGQFANGSTER